MMAKLSHTSQKQKARKKVEIDGVPLFMLLSLLATSRSNSAQVNFSIKWNISLIQFSLQFTYTTHYRQLCCVPIPSFKLTSFLRFSLDDCNFNFENKRTRYLGLTTFKALRIEN